MIESLDDFPESLRDTDVYPWDREPEAEAGYRWLWGLDRGKPLIDIDSRELLRKRRWLEARSGPNRCYGALIAEVDKVLLARMGE